LAATVSLEAALREELPSLARSPALALTAVFGIGDVAAAVGNPCDRVPSFAAVVGPDMVARASPRFLSRLGLATVESKVFVSDLTTGGNGKYIVGRTVDAEVGNSNISSVATAELSTGNNGNSFEDVY
jgi:hypothetical protein